jgi:hypothetical protein
MNKMFITVFTRAGRSVKSNAHPHVREAVTPRSIVFLKKMAVAQLHKLLKQELRNMNCSPNMITVIKQRKMCCNVALVDRYQPFELVASIFSVDPTRLSQARGELHG